MHPRVTISMPCFARPQRTRRAINCILNQTVQDWEAFIIGDCCPEFEKIQREGALDDPRIHKWNWHTNKGGSGYYSTNVAILKATGQYFLFYANDDVISPVHMQVYLEQIEGTDLDFVFYDYLVFNRLAKTKIAYGHIGHSALIIRTDFLKKMPPHSPAYGHDFDLILNMMKAGAKYKKADRIIPTYYVMGNPKKRDHDPENID